MLDSGRDRLFPSVGSGTGSRDWRWSRLSVIEQRYRAVMAVVDGAAVTEVAAEVAVSRQSVHAWVARYRNGGLAGVGGPATRTKSPHTNRRGRAGAHTSPIARHAVVDRRPQLLPLLT